MSFVNIGRNFNDLISGLSSLRRRAQLTGQPFSSRDFSNIADSYFASAREAAPAQASLGLQQQALEQQSSQFGQQLAETKRQAEEQARLQERQNMTAQEQMDQARKLGLVNTGIQGTGAGLLGYHILREPAKTTVPGGSLALKSGSVFDPFGPVSGGTPGTAPPWWSGSSGTLGPAGVGAAAYLGSRLTGNALDQTKEVPKEVVTALKYPLTGIGSVAGGTLSDVTGIKELAEPTNFLRSAEQTIQDIITAPFGGGK